MPNLVTVGEIDEFLGKHPEFLPMREPMIRLAREGILERLPKNPSKSDLAWLVGGLIAFGAVTLAARYLKGRS